MIQPLAIFFLHRKFLANAFSKKSVIKKVCYCW